jgi:hypothetical protein
MRQDLELLVQDGEFCRDGLDTETFGVWLAHQHIDLVGQLRCLFGHVPHRKQHSVDRVETGSETTAGAPAPLAWAISSVTVRPLLRNVSMVDYSIPGECRARLGRTPVGASS